MRKQIIDEATCYHDLFTDDDGYTWNLVVRKDRSVSVYATYPGDALHYVVYDSLDKLPFSDSADVVIERLRDMHEGLNALFETLEAA